MSRNVSISEMHRRWRVEHVAGEDLSPSPACPICGFGGRREPILRLQSDPEVDYLRCPECRGASTSRLPTPDYLNRYYARYYDDAKAHFTFGNMNKFVRHLASGIRFEDRSTLSILDFGGGDGSLALGLARRLGRDRRVSVTIVDLSAPPAAAHSGIEVRTHQRLDQVDVKHDVVLASAVIEHLLEPGTALRELMSLIAPRGYFYARTPYALPLRALRSSHDLLFPMHVHDLGAEFWNRAPARFGFVGEYVWSQPSVVESTLLADPMRTIAAHLLKLPARLELLLARSERRDVRWRWVGGWEILLRAR
ncbi:MAG: methyltransferase domain-containing protein [Deltaproteobacteria bacterium]|nr:methyltransferase domain-containing protein [Deltaproteobacteria bacterium]